MPKSSPVLVFLFCIFVFLGIGYLYYLVYEPVYYVNSVKMYNSEFIQGDVFTYINYAKSEIENRSFFEWFLKLDSNTISLVYFSWITGLLNKFNIPDIYLTSSILIATYLILFKMARLHQLNIFYLSYSVLTSFSLIVYMQTFTKEILLLPFLMLSLWSLQTKKYKITLISLFFLTIIRAYFSMAILLSLAFFYIWKKKPKPAVLYAIAASSVFLPLIFTKMVTSFTINMNQSHGLYRYYLSTLEYYGLYLFWLPLKVFQNFAEPFLALINQNISSSINQVSVVLDCLTSLSMIFLVFAIYRMRRRLNTSDDMTIYLVIFTMVYFFMIAVTPIVHFRYLVPLLPILGILADRLAKKELLD